MLDGKGQIPDHSPANWFSGRRNATLLVGMASKSRDELLVTPIGELAACWIGVRCTDRCRGI
jgi:hypothetical protein